MAEYIDIHVIYQDGKAELAVKDDRGDGAASVGTWVDSQDGRFLRIHRDSVERFRKYQPEVQSFD